MKKTFHFALMAVLTVGLSLAATSCKDDDKNNDNGENMEQMASTGGDLTMDEVQLSSLISNFSAVQADELLAQSGWQQKTYEATLGTVLDESRPTVRSIELGTIEAADGKRTYAPTKGGLGPNDRAITSSSTGSVTAVTRAFKGISNSTLVLYTSPYADFANQIMLAGEVNITGVITRYRDTWQIYMRVIDDIESATPTDPAVE